MNVRDRRKLEMRFGWMQVLYWLFIGAFFTYIVTLLDSRGMTGTQVGLLSGMMMCASILGQFLLGGIADASRKNRLIYILSCAATCAAFIGVYLSRDFYLTAVCMILLGLFKEPSAAVLDSWIIKCLDGDASSFGSIRAKGSIAFALEMLVYGWMLDFFGYEIMPWVTLGTLVLLVLSALTVPELSRTETVTEKVHVEKPAASKAIFAMLTPVLLLFILVSGILGMSIQPVYYFHPLVLQAIGGTTTLLGISYFINAGIEFFFMKGLRCCSRMTAYQRLLLSIGLYVFSTLIMAFTENVYIILIMMGINGAGFGSQLPARRAIVTELVPERFQTTLHGVSDMMFTGLGPMIGNALAGVILDLSGCKAMLLICCAAQMVTLLLAWVLAHAGKRRVTS